MLKLWITLVCVSMAAHVKAHVIEHTNGTSGELCGGQRCISPHAICQEGRCVCQSPYSEGIGTFHCYKPSDYFCAVFNDPIIRGFDGTHVKIPLVNLIPCAGVSTGICGDFESTNASCLIQLGTYGSRSKGKTYVEGYVVYVYINYDGEEYSEEMRGLTFGSSGIYTYNTTSDDLNIPGLPPITTVFDEVNNFARITLQPCGVDIGIRGVEQDGDPLVMPAGIYITVSTECGPNYVQPVFEYTELTLCSPPPGQGFTIDDAVADLSEKSNRSVSRETAMLYRTLLAGGVTQDFPGAPTSALDYLTSVVNNCADTYVVDALVQCAFILTSPRFFRCYDHTSNAADAIGLMSACISALCDRDVIECQSVRFIVWNSGCAGKIQEDQTTILDNTCDFDE